MGDNYENSGYAMFRDEMRRQEEERRLQMDEFNTRYAERKRQKQQNRRELEGAAMEICRIVTDTLANHKDDLTPEDLHFLAGAISNAATALNTLEQYAEYVPMHSGVMGIAV